MADHVDAHFNEAGDHPSWELAGDATRFPPLVMHLAPVEATALTLAHPSTPFFKPLGNDLKALEIPVQTMACEYLLAVQHALDLPPHWLDALVNSENPQFGWMPIQEWPVDSDGEFTEPFGSYYTGDLETGSLAVVLYASDRIEPQFIGSEFGLRLVIRITETELHSGNLLGSIGGIDVSPPYGPYWHWGETPCEVFSTPSLRSDFLNNLLGRRDSIAEAAGLEEPTLKIRSLRIGPLGNDGDYQIEWRGVGFTGENRQYADDDDDDPSDDAELQAPESFTVSGTYRGDIYTLINRSSVIASSAGDAPVFWRDRASSPPATSLMKSRPTRSDELLNPARTPETITGVLNGSLSYKPVAGYPAFIEVRPCPDFVLADAPLNPALPYPITLPGGNDPLLRTDRASAVQGFRHARELLERLTAYGLPPQTYFKIAKPRLLVAYRSGISPGPGKTGRTVNACVHPRGWPTDMVGPNPVNKRPPLIIHLACANLSRQSRGIWTGPAPMPKEPFGIGADSRWMWHEFGHVLLMATTGELEMRFAHSPGDALAAIVADPDDINRGRPLRRFATFPWVIIPRRHDRPVVTGWSWSGTMHAELAAVPNNLHPRRKGYESEQILSTSLYRLYRCLGGDTNTDSFDTALHERLRASHYAVYLIAKALAVLGDARVAPANIPEQFVGALVSADILAGVWNATYPAATPPHDRTGGCATKVIRWAFEAQGLYPDPAATSGNAIGMPPQHDIFIASRRPTVDQSTPYGDVDYGAGSYLPVSLHWQTALGDPIPEWQASPIDGIRHLGGNSFEVEVGNRGTLTTHGVRVALFWASFPLGSAPPKWPDAAWSAVGSIGPQSINPGAPVTFGPFTIGGADRRLILAVANGFHDRANINPLTFFPCALNPTRIIDQVANDNNLALLVF